MGDVAVFGPRFTFAVHALIGTSVKLQTTDERWHEGIYESMSPDGSITIRWLKPTSAPGAPASERAKQQSMRPLPHKVFAKGEVLQLVCHTACMSGADVGPKAADDGSGVGTDAAIGHGKGGTAGRRLERWSAPDGADVAALELEDGSGDKWDQFEANKRLFNVTSSYRDDLYSTKYDPSKSRYSEDDARRIEQEILRNGKTGNLHLREERGLAVDDSGQTEEDRFSAVVRHNSASSTSAAAAAAAAAAGAADGAAAAARQPLRGAWAQAPVFGGPLPTSGATRSSPIAINSRAEANRVRAALSAGTPKSKSTSPYGTPKDALEGSPLVHDAKGLVALNLDPGRGAPTDPETRLEYFNWRKQNKDMLASSMGSTSSEGTQRSLTMSARGVSSSGGPLSALPTAHSATSVPTAPAAAAAALPATPLPSQPTAHVNTAQNGEGQADPAAAPAQDGPAESAARPGTSKPTSKLNPNAKPFTMNPNASAFVPGGASSAVQSEGGASVVAGTQGLLSAGALAKGRGPLPGALQAQLGRQGKPHVPVDRTLSSSSAGSSTFALSQGGQGRGSRNRGHHQQQQFQQQQQQFHYNQQHQAGGAGSGPLVSGRGMGEPYVSGWPMGMAVPSGYMAAPVYHPAGGMAAMMQGGGQAMYMSNGSGMRPTMMPMMMGGYPSGMPGGSPGNPMGGHMGTPGRPMGTGPLAGNPMMMPPGALQRVHMGMPQGVMPGANGPYDQPM